MIVILVSSFKQRNVWARFWSVFMVGEQVSIIFSTQIFYEVLDIFPRLSYIYHVEFGDGRQRRILVDNF